MSKITLKEFETLPVLEGQPFMVPGSTKRYLDKDLAQQQEFVKEGNARIYVIHFYEATMNTSGNISITLVSDTIVDETKPEIPDIDFRSFLGKTKADRINEIKARKLNKRNTLWSRIIRSIRVLLGKE